MKMKGKIITGLMLFLSACSIAQPDIVATSGGAGTLGKPHWISKMLVTDVRGKGSGFIAGAVSGCCARSGIQLSVPNGIEGEWSQGWDTGGEWEEKWRQRWKPAWGNFEENYIKDKWFYIKDTIDSDLAAKKIEIMDNYFNEDELGRGAMEVYVDGRRVVLAYVKLCNPKRGYDCSIKENADPHGWVVPPPWSKTGKGTAVILYDGYGEESDKPFSESY
ncbi:hypothetical protein [Vibrio jasicida]|uniref:hypothetical protein n=1 Tax=Vibrio jasicida TaxID=766224 RepID=UPI0040686EF4